MSAIRMLQVGTGRPDVLLSRLTRHEVLLLTFASLWSSMDFGGLEPRPGQRRGSPITVWNRAGEQCVFGKLIVVVLYVSTERGRQYEQDSFSS